MKKLKLGAQQKILITEIEKFDIPRLQNTKKAT